MNVERATLQLGKLPLAKGQNYSSIEVVSKPGTQGMDFKHVHLTRLPANSR